MKISVGIVLSKKYTNLYICGLSKNNKIISNLNCNAHIAWLPLPKLYPPKKSEEINVVLATQFAIDMGLCITEDPNYKHRVAKTSLQDIQKWVNNATKNIKIAVRAIRPGEVLILYPSDDLDCVNFDTQTPTDCTALTKIKNLVPGEDYPVSDYDFEYSSKWITSVWWIDRLPVCFILAARE